MTKADLEIETSHFMDRLYAEAQAGNHEAAGEFLNRAKSTLHELSTHSSSTPAGRKRLPASRNSITKKLELGAFDGYVTVGFYDNNQPGELFLKFSKMGSVLSGMADGIAVAASIALQHGVPWATLADKYQHMRFDPSDENHSSLLDLLAEKVSEAISERGGLEDKGYDAT